MAFDSHERLRAEPTSLVEHRRADYRRMRAADEEVTREELSEARNAYEQALVRLSYSIQRVEVTCSVDHVDPSGFTVSP